MEMVPPKKSGLLGPASLRVLHPLWNASAAQKESSPNLSLIQSVVRAHVWTQNLHDGTYETIEALAEANGLHPKVIRLALRLAFLSPEVTSGILEGRQQTGLSLGKIPKLLPLPWTEHQSLLS